MSNSKYTMKVLSNAIGKCVDLNIDSKRRIRWVQILNQDCFHIDLHVLKIVYSEVIFDRLSKTYLYMDFYRFSNNTMVFFKLLPAWFKNKVFTWWNQTIHWTEKFLNVGRMVMVTDKDYFHYHSSTLQWLNIIITNYDYTCMISCAHPASWPFYGWWGVWGIYCGGGSGKYIYVCKGGSNAYFRF